MTNLSISSSGGTQASTQSPQALVSSGNSTEAASNVQPGGTNVQSEIATTPIGIALYPTQLPTINVNNSSEPTTGSNAIVATTTQPKRHIDSGLLAVSAGLLIIAVIMFWVTTRSAKNTTNYK